jgi:hypothetical protein
MASSPGTLQQLAQQLALAVQPLKAAVADLPSFQTFLYRLGWNVKSLPPQYTALGAQVDATFTALSGLGDSPSAAQILDLLSKVKALYVALKGIATAPDGVDATAFLEEVGESIFELLLADYLDSTFPSIQSALLALDIMVEKYQEATPDRPAALLTRFQWDQIPKILSDPGSVPTLVYGWGTDDLDFHRLAGHLLALFDALNFPAYLGRVDEDMGRGYLDTPDDTTVSIDWGLTIPILQDNIAGTQVELGLALLELPPQSGQHAGLILQPLVPAALGTSYQISDSLKLTLRAGSDVAQTLGVLLRPSGLSVKYPFQPGAALPEAGFGVTLTYAPSNPTVLLGDPSATRLSMQGASFALEIDTDQDGVELKGSAAVIGLSVVLSSQDPDSFLHALLGGQDSTIAIPLTLEWSSRSGLSFAGDTGLSVTQNMSHKLGPVTMQAVRFALRSSTGAGDAPDLILEAGVSFGADIGPISASVSNTGLRLTMTFEDGNAGAFDFSVGFMPPNGVGLAVDSAGLTGGGFLSHDDAARQYAGMLQLAFEEFQLQAFGLVATILPTGPGYSIIAMIDATFPPIELIAGFTLNGVGGLLGINRTISIDALEAGLKAKTLSNFLFAKNPIANAPQLLTDLATFFPAADGRYVFGPLLQIGWGTPTVITIDLALILELPDPVRLVLLGELIVLLPVPDAALLELHMDVLGTLDFGTDEGGLDAQLHDSRLIKFPLMGAMALRGCWAGTDKTFLLSVGGFHPKFQPPPAFPTLDRVSVSLANGNIAKLNLNGYFAVSSNTLQIGAHVDLSVGVDGFGIAGYLNFDTLIERNPFYFDGDISGGVTLSAGGDNLMTLDLVAEMTGPAPWHVTGSVHFSILGFGVSKSFSTTFGDPVAALAADLIDVASALTAALADPRNYAATLTTGANGLVSLRAPVASGVVVGHPSAALTVNQRVVPLGLTIQKFGAGAPQGASLFTISGVTTDGATQPTTPVTDEFAPAQYLNLSDDDALANPPFETFDSGVALGGGSLQFGPIITREIDYETWLVDAPGGTPREDTGITLPANHVFGILTGLLDSGRLRYAAPSQIVIKAATLDYVVATTDQIAASTVGVATGQTYAQARAALAAAVVQNPSQRGTLQVVARYEVP